jgi:hypothetical protein
LKPSILATVVPQGPVVTLQGINQKIRIGQGFVKTLTIVCLGLDLNAATLPVTHDCGGSYSEVEAPAGSQTSWADDTGVMVTVTKFDGAKIQGTFEGSWPAGKSNPGVPPASLEGGKFKMKVIAP